METSSNFGSNSTFYFVFPLDIKDSRYECELVKLNLGLTPHLGWDLGFCVLGTFTFTNPLICIDQTIIDKIISLV